MSIWSRIFGRREPAPADSAHDEEVERAWYGEKSGYLESLLGKEHDHVMHALIPYEIGGALDLYYYPNGIPGTAIATKELVASDGKGPSNSFHHAYELVMFTRERLNLDLANDSSTAFGRAHASINSILNRVARYSEQATLNPLETCEFPEEMESVGGKCLIFDSYSPKASKPMGLMLLIEVFRDEMNFARNNGGAALIALLKSNGVYPYSDLVRSPVVGNGD